MEIDLLDLELWSADLLDFNSILSSLMLLSADFTASVIQASKSRASGEGFSSLTRLAGRFLTSP